MTKNFCKQCGNALTKAGAKFCTTCGATVDGADIVDISNQETVALPGEQKNQADFSTEVIPAINPVSFATEEMPKPVITARAAERSTEVIEAVALTPATRPLQLPLEPAQAAPPVAQKPEKKSEKETEKKSEQKSGKKSEQKSEKKSVEKSGGQKKLALAAAFGVVALVVVVAASFFLINSRNATEAQSVTQPAGGAQPSTSASSAQPIAQQSNPSANPPTNSQSGQPSGAGSNNQAQSQPRPQSGPSTSEAKSPAVQNNAAASKPQQQAAVSPTPSAPKLTAKDHEKLGNDYQNSGRYQEALQEYEQMKRLDPGNKDVYYLMGLTYGKMNQLDKALESYRQCTSGTYVGVAQSAVKNLEKKLKVSAK
jgi:cytochrome c-type biogenesis protein CcmH/NrfG